MLDVDAFDIGIGGILHQVQDGRERVIAYASRALNKAEKNYCITEKEFLAVRYFIKYFRQYLLGRRFLVRRMMHKSVYKEMVDSSTTLPKTTTVNSVDLQDDVNSEEHSDNQNINIQMTRMVNEASQPTPGPSNEEQQCNPSEQKHSTVAITWVGDDDDDELEFNDASTLLGH